MGYVMWTETEAVSLGTEWLYKLGMQPWIRPDQTSYFFFHKIQDKREDSVMRALARDDSKTLKWEQNVLRLTPAGWVWGEGPSAADKHPHNQSAADRSRWCRSDYDMYIFPSCLLNILLWPNRQRFSFWYELLAFQPDDVLTSKALPCDKWSPSQMEG